MRHFTLFDQIILKLESLDSHFRPTTNKLSESLMRVNHSGEVCAQALYLGQALVARDPKIEATLNEAAQEEQTHLEWCRARIEALNGKPSLLNPLWALGSFGIGVTAGLMGDKISLGFLAETEHQVVRHIDKHLTLLPSEDHKSREILLKMREDELRHATNALHAGGVQFPTVIRGLMNCASKIMTFTSRYI